MKYQQVSNNNNSHYILIVTAFRANEIIYVNN